VPRHRFPPKRRSSREGVAFAVEADEVLPRDLLDDVKSDPEAVESSAATEPTLSVSVSSSGSSFNPAVPKVFQLTKPAPMLNSCSDSSRSKISLSPMTRHENVPKL
jgi:hypothetical protein